MTSDTQRSLRVLLMLALGLNGAVPQSQAFPEAIETGPNDQTQSPASQQASGIIGDFVLRHEPEFSGLGRPSIRRYATAQTGAKGEPAVTTEAASVVAFDIRDESGRSIPCKAQFIGRGSTPSPVLGPAFQAHGCVDQYHSERGEFRVQLPPGRYGVLVTRGIEYSHLARRVELAAGQTAMVQGTLRRLVDTRGWISADFHNHSLLSGDTTCSPDDRIINLVAEHIEFAPATEHNRSYDWRPHIAKLGLTDEIASVPGLELTGLGAHLNAFPFAGQPATPDDSAPQWCQDPRLSAIVLRNHQGREPDRWVQLNHPDLVGDFIDYDGDGVVDGGYAGLEQLIDGIEIQNGVSVGILSPAPVQVVRDRYGKELVWYFREFNWLQLLNRGLRCRAVTASDAHSVYGDGVGGWRMYVPSSSDRPAQVDWREISRHAKAGRIILTTGPFLEVGTEDGTGPGGETRASGTVQLRVRVQCTEWIDIDRVQVLVNGRQRSDLNFTRVSHPEWFHDGVVKFERTVPITLREDSHLIVVAYGERFDLSVGYGTSEQAALRPCAYNNPIFVDVDGGGFVANGDTLGWPLVLGHLSVEQARQMLDEHAR